MALGFNLPSQIVVKTAVQWAADNTVYSDKRILVTSDEYFGTADQRKFKIADGVQTWSNLDYPPFLTSANITQAITSGVTDKAPSEDAVFDALALKQDSLGYTAEDTSNKSSSYTASSTTTYANTKALVDGLATKLNSNDASVTNARINRAIFKQNITLSHTGDTSNTLKYSSLIAAGTFEANDLLKFAALIGATSNANAKTIRFYFNTSASLSGATLIGSHALSSGALTIAVSRFMAFQNSVSSQLISPSGVSYQSEYVASTSAPSTLSVNFAVDQYFIIALQLGNSADTAYIYALTSETYR